MKNSNPVSTSYLQEFGCLLITDIHLTILGICESAVAIAGIPATEILGQPLQTFLTRLLPDGHDDIIQILIDLQHHKIPRQVVSKRIDGTDYYFKCSMHESLMYIEWEEQHQLHIPAYQLNDLGFLFDRSYDNNWSYVCRAINRQLRFDQVFVLQVHETGQSKVIAGETSNVQPFVEGKEFSRDFLSEDLLLYYDSLSYRYVPSFHHVHQKFYSIQSVDVLCSQLAPPPLLHQVYLTKLGIQSALFFPLYLDGHFWGMVCAHNRTQKDVDLQTRKLCTFIVQNAMSKFENTVKQGLLDRNQEVLKVEAQLKEQLLRAKTVNCVMVQNMELLQDMCKADGVAIYNQGDVFCQGKCPDPEQFYEIIELLKKLTTKTIFKDYNFRLSHGAKIKGKLPIAGILSYTIGQDKDYYIVWFRNEKITTEVQMEADIDLAEIKTATVKTWEKTIYDSADRWDDDDLFFVKSLERVVNESILNKTKEKQLLNEELLLMNNELELFTFSISHDLKNPLSVLKMGIQFLSKTNQLLPADKRLECYSNLKGSISNIEGIINNIVTLSQSKTTAITKDPIPMSYTIRKISQDATLLYKSEGCTFHFGKLYPLWGEKSALYQIFLNLIGNAVKYSSAQSKPEVWIKSDISPTEVSYCIKDNGIGIPKDTLPHIFDMFTRAPNACTFHGSGVGLSLVKRIMERLGGSIEVKSVENEGTEFTLYFPVVSDFPPSMLH